MQKKKKVGYYSQNHELHFSAEIKFEEIFSEGYRTELYRTIHWDQCFLSSIFYICDCIGTVRKPDLQNLWLALSLLVKKYSEKG